MNDAELKAFAEQHAPALAKPIVEMVAKIIEKGLVGIIEQAASERLNRAAAAPEGLTEQIDTIIRDVAGLKSNNSEPDSIVVTADELRVILERNLATPDAKTAEARKPLTEERLERMWLHITDKHIVSKAAAFALIREYERVHGIGDQP